MKLTYIYVMIKDTAQVNIIDVIRPICNINRL